MQEDIKNAIKVLKNGGLILYPTDTIWGIGCDATNEEAVKKIYKIKQRNDNKSLLVLVNSATMIEYYVDELSDLAFDIFELSIEPTTLILDKAKNLAKNLINIDGSVGFRVTKEEFTNKLISQFRLPIVSTSANISGQTPAVIFDEISEEIINSVDYVVKYRQDDLTKAKPSRILKLTNSGEITIIR
jgi:L-threonylcarbamoyladenylate synthase